MGCGPSTPVRPSPLSVDAQASPLILCKRGSASQLVFQNIEYLQAQQAVPMTLASHPGLAIVARGAENSLRHGGDTWCYNELGIGVANMALSMQFDGEGFLTSTHAPNGGAAASMVLDISWWHYEEGNTVNLVGEERRNDRSRDRGGGRTFVLNSDGTIGAAHQPHLVLGMQLPDVALVNANSAEALRFQDAPNLASGHATSLVLSSHPGYAVCPKHDPKTIDDWHIDYQNLGVGLAKDPMQLRLEGPFMMSAHPSSQNFVLDVPFGQLHANHEHCMSVISIHDRSKNKEHGNQARLFRVNGDGTVSPTAAPHLVLGVRPGSRLPNLMGTMPPAYQPHTSPQVPMVEATVVVPQAQPVVPEGIPVTASVSSSSGKRTIAEMAKICESQLGVSGNVMSVIKQAAEHLNVKAGDRPLMEVAEECMRVMGY